MRCNRFFAPTLWLRALALVGIMSIGLISAIGSGGGYIGLPSDCPAGLDCSHVPPPLPTVSVQPPYVTALVGTPVTYTAEASNILGNLTYQWSRSFDGGATYADISGATGKTYSLASANLGDDAAIFAVVVRGSNAAASAVSHLVVSAVPGVVYEDGEFQGADWLVTPFADSNGLSPAHTEERVATGGNPGAYRKMVF